MRKFDNKSCEGIMLMSKESFTPKLEKAIGKVPSFLSCCEAKGMKPCTQVLRTCMHKCLVLDFHLFAQIWFQRLRFQTVHKIQPICNFLKKMTHNKHAQACKEH